MVLHGTIKAGSCPAQGGIADINAVICNWHFEGTCTQFKFHLHISHCCKVSLGGFSCIHVQHVASMFRSSLHFMTFMQYAFNYMLQI